VRDRVHRDGAEQESGEPAGADGADHQELGFFGRRTQHLRGRTGEEFRRDAEVLIALVQLGGDLTRDALGPAPGALWAGRRGM